MSDRIIFVDCETTGLEADRHEPWEIALLTPAGLDDQHAGLTQTWQVHADLATAEPKALQIGGYYERFGENDVSVQTPEYVALQVAKLTSKVTLAGANPAFDAAMLGAWLRKYGQAPAWHFRLLDVETYTAGVLGWPVPRGLKTTADELAVKYDPAELHTAAADVRLAYEVYLAARARIGASR